MILKAKANTSLFKGDVNFLTFRLSQLKPLNHLIKKRWKIDQGETKRERQVNFWHYTTKSWKITLGRAIRIFFMPTPVRTQLEGGISSSVVATQGRGSVRPTRHFGTSAWRRCTDRQVNACRNSAMQRLVCLLGMPPFLQHEKTSRQIKELLSQKHNVNGLETVRIKRESRKCLIYRRTFFVRRKTCIRKIHCEKDFLCYKKEDKTPKIIALEPLTTHS